MTEIIIILKTHESAIRRVSGPLLSIRRTTWRRSMGRKTPQGRTGKLIRPLTNRITNRFTIKEGLKLTTANLVVSNCSTEFDQTKGKISKALGISSAYSNLF